MMMYHAHTPSYTGKKIILEGVSKYILHRACLPLLYTRTTDREEGGWEIQKKSRHGIAHTKAECVTYPRRKIAGSQPPTPSPGGQ